MEEDPSVLVHDTDQVPFPFPNEKFFELVDAWADNVKIIAIINRETQKNAISKVFFVFKILLIILFFSPF